MNQEIRLAFQNASLGEIPASLRFVYANYDKHLHAYHFHACYTNEATDDDLECARNISTEMLSHYSDILNMKITEDVIKDSEKPWKIDGGFHLLYLRHGELDQ